MKKSKKVTAALLSMALMAGMVGCATAETQTSQENGTAVSESASADNGEPDLSFSKRDRDPSYDEATATKIDLSGSTATVSGDGATVDGSTVTITADGTYIVKGSLSNGQILVNLPGDEDKAQIVLDGVTIHNETGPALYVQQADKVFVTLAEGSANEFTDGADYAATDDGNDPKAALYSKDDLTINGSGALNVTGNYYHGISSTDDLVITGGTIVVTSKEDAFHGKDAIKIGGGTLTVNAGDDAFHSEYLFYIEDGTVNVEKCTEGYEAEKVYVYGGDTTIVASDDGVNAAAAEEEITDGTTDGASAQTDRIETGGGMPSDGEMPELPEGERPALPDGATGERSDGAMGERPDGTMGGRGNGGGGKFDGQPPQEGEMPQGQAPDGMAEGGRQFRGGPSADQDGTGIPQMREGAQPSADDQAMARDDQASTDTDKGMGRGFGGGMGGAMVGASQDCLIRINGGTLRVDAGGDGLDSNGSIEINGGTVFVSGSTSSSDSGLDYEFGATVNGGDIIIVGAAGMAEDFTGGTQTHLMERANGAAGSTVEVLDASGNVLVSYTAPKAFQAVVASAPNCTTVVVR